MHGNSDVVLLLRFQCVLHQLRGNVRIAGNAGHAFFVGQLHAGKPVCRNLAKQLIGRALAVIMQAGTNGKYGHNSGTSLLDDHFGIGQQQGSNALGVVFHNRLAEIVFQAAIAAGGAAQTGYQADAGQLQLALIVHAQVFVTGAIECLFAVSAEPLGQVAQPHAFEHGVSEQGAAGGFQIVARYAGFINDMPVSAS